MATTILLFFLGNQSLLFGNSANLEFCFIILHEIYDLSFM